VTECNETDARTWGTLLQVTPGRLPDDFADALTERLSAVSEHDEFELDRIGSRFVEEDRVDALRALAAKNEALGTRLRPYLAALGDPIQVRTLLDGLKQSLSTGETADRLDLTWLNGAAQEEFLDELFECLVLARRFERNPFGASGMLESAIAQVGGMDAVAKYDEVIAKHPFDGAQFLRLQRDRLAQAELQKVGNLSAADLAELLGVPLLEANGADRPGPFGVTRQ